MKKNILAYSISAIVGAAIVVAVICGQKIWEISSTRGVLQMLCDGFFAAGVVLGGVGLLIFASNHGAFDMLAYAVRWFFYKFKRDLSKRKYKDFKDYREQKAEREKLSTGFMFFVGLGYLAVAIALLIAYYNI